MILSVISVINKYEAGYTQEIIYVAPSRSRSDCFVSPVFSVSYRRRWHYAGRAASNHKGSRHRRLAVDSPSDQHRKQPIRPGDCRPDRKNPRPFREGWGLRTPCQSARCLGPAHPHRQTPSSGLPRSPCTAPTSRIRRAACPLLSKDLPMTSWPTPSGTPAVGTWA